MPDTKYDLAAAGAVFSATAVIAVAAKNGWTAVAVAAASVVLIAGLVRAVFAPKWRNPVDRAREEGRREQWKLDHAYESLNREPEVTAARR